MGRKSIYDLAVENYRPPEKRERVDFVREVMLTFSNRRSLFSSKKIERFVVFWVFLVITVMYLTRKLDELESMDFVEVVALWLAYGGYNTFLTHRERTQKKEEGPPIEQAPPDSPNNAS